MRMSIAIPTWEIKGKGNQFLQDLLRTLEIQTFQDFEVVISDHSKDNKLIDVIEEFQNKLNILYFKNINNRGNGPANTNNAINHCSGEIIKVMFQDDFFYDDKALQKIYDSFDEDHNWLVCGSNHTKDDGNSFYRKVYPKWNSKLLEGVNTISSPSVMAVKRKVFDQIKFDEKLVMMMDCEIYYSIKNIFGDPIYLHNILVSNRIHSEQISSQYSSSSDFSSILSKEIDYCKSKHLR